MDDLIMLMVLPNSTFVRFVFNTWLCIHDVYYCTMLYYMYYTYLDNKWYFTQNCYYNMKCNSKNKRQRTYHEKTKISFSHIDLGVEICPFGFLILQGFGFQFYRLAESTLCLVSHKAPNPKTSEVYLQLSGYDPRQLDLIG